METGHSTPWTLQKITVHNSARILPEVNSEHSFNRRSIHSNGVDSTLAFVTISRLRLRVRWKKHFLLVCAGTYFSTKPRRSTLPMADILYPPPSKKFAALLQQ